MQTQAKFCVRFTETNMGKPKLPLIPKVGPSLSTKKKLLWHLSVWDDKVLPTQKITTLLAKSLPKFHGPALSNVIPQPPYIHFSLSLFFSIWVAANKKLLNLKLVEGFLGQASKS